MTLPEELIWVSIHGDQGQAIRIMERASKEITGLYNHATAREIEIERLRAALDQIVEICNGIANEQNAVTEEKDAG